MAINEGGDREERSVAFENAVVKATDGRGTLKVPAKEGPYRLFVYVSDQKGKVATANIPFYVKP
jgi:hypothetical protein